MTKFIAGLPSRFYGGRRASRRSVFCSFSVSEYYKIVDRCNQKPGAYWFEEGSRFQLQKCLVTKEIVI